MTLCFLPSPTLTGSRLVRPSVLAGPLCAALSSGRVLGSKAFSQVEFHPTTVNHLRKCMCVYCVLCICMYIYIYIQVCHVNQEDKSCFIYKPIGHVPLNQLVRKFGKWRSGSSMRGIPIACLRHKSFIQGGPLLDISSGVKTPINGLING